MSPQCQRPRFCVSYVGEIGRRAKVMVTDLAMLPFSFLAGVATFFNPCFGALLPAYASLYFARDEADSASWWLRGVHGLSVGGVISAGFLTSLGGLGVVFALIGTAIARYLPWVAVLVGVLMVITGAGTKPQILLSRT